MKTLGKVVRLILFVVTSTLLMVSQAQASQLPAASDHVTSRSANEQSYIVVLKSGQSAAGYNAIREAGGTIVRSNKLDIATVTSSNPSFAESLDHSDAILGVARNAGFYQAPAAPLAVPPPPNTHT